MLFRSLLEDDYRSVGIPMLPVVRGPLVTGRAIARYAWATVAVSVLGVLTLPAGGAFYGLMVLPFNGRLLQMGEAVRRDPGDRSLAKGLFRWSILYLFGLCLLLLLARTPAAMAFSHDTFTLLRRATGLAA